MSAACSKCAALDRAKRWRGRADVALPVSVAGAPVASAAGTVAPTRSVTIDNVVAPGMTDGVMDGVVITEGWVSAVASTAEVSARFSGIAALAGVGGSDGAPATALRRCKTGTTG